MTLFEHMSTLGWLYFLFVWLGHACLWCYLLNNSYALPITKAILKPWRVLCGFMIVAGFPIGAALFFPGKEGGPLSPNLAGDFAATFVLVYMLICMACTCAFLIITLARLARSRPECVRSDQSHTIDLGKQCGPAILGDGSWRTLANLPFNYPFRVEFTGLTLKLERLPPALDGLTILYLSDMHFCGTPSQAYFNAILDEIAKQPTPDIVALGGDYADSTEHVAWLAPFLSRLKWSKSAFALLGNHDHRHDPQAVRDTLSAAGVTVLSNVWKEVTIRGERVVVVGHEGPWNRPGPDLNQLPKDGFRLGLSHTPDNFPGWAAGNLDLLLCGHTHGGQIRLPIIGSIFVPSAYSRKYDQGVFKNGRTTMVVGRGLGGKEPIRVNCPPQVLRITLTR